MNNNNTNIGRIAILMLDMIFLALPLVMYSLGRISCESAILSLILVVFIATKLNDNMVKEPKCE